MATRKMCADCGHRADYHNAFGTMPCAQCACSRLRIPAPKPEKPKAPPKPRHMRTDFKAFEIDIRQVERAAEDVLRQCALLRANGEGDTMRVWFIERDTRKALAAAEKSVRRYAYSRYGGEPV